MKSLSWRTPLADHPAPIGFTYPKKWCNAFNEHTEWPRLTGLRFHQAVCVRASSAASTRDVIVRLDNASQVVMGSWAAQLEQKLRSAGVNVSVPRAHQVFFHSTIGRYNSTASAATAATAVNAAVRKKGAGWTAGHPFSVRAVRCNGWPGQQHNSSSPGQCPGWHPHPP